MDLSFFENNHQLKDWSHHKEAQFYPKLTLLLKQQPKKKKKEKIFSYFKKEL